MDKLKPYKKRQLSGGTGGLEMDKNIIGKKVKLKNGTIGVAAHYLFSNGKYVLRGGKGFAIICEFKENEIATIEQEKENG